METRRHVIGIACLLASGVLVAWGLTALMPTQDGSVHVISPLATAMTIDDDVVRFGDCGDRRRDGVRPVACSDPRADVEVGARRALGDPRTACPLFDADTVLTTSGGVGSLYVCWVPIGGGPERTITTPRVVDVATTAADFTTGTCGDVHDQHVHAPLSCADPRADGEVVGSANDAGSCPIGTLLAVPGADRRTVCWGPR